MNSSASPPQGLELSSSGRAEGKREFCARTGYAAVNCRDKEWTMRDSIARPPARGGELRERRQNTSRPAVACPKLPSLLELPVGGADGGRSTMVTRKISPIVALTWCSVDHRKRSGEAAEHGGNSPPAFELVKTMPRSRMSGVRRGPGGFRSDPQGDGQGWISADRRALLESGPAGITESIAA